MADTLDLRTYITLEEALTKRLVKDWQKRSEPIYAAIHTACLAHQWDKARLLVPDLDLTEVGTENRQWIKYLLLACANFGAGQVAKGKPSFVGVGTFDTTLNQVTDNILVYLEHSATADVQEQALQLIAEDESKSLVQKSEHKFGNTQIDIDPMSDAAQSLKDARYMIRTRDLMGQGLDNTNHVTVRYGIENPDVDGLRDYIAGLTPFTAQLDGVMLFDPSEHSEDATPVVARVVSPELHFIHKEIENHGDFIEGNFTVYRPHCTLAYCKPDIAALYLDLQVRGSFLVRSITISHKSGVMETIPFGIVRKGGPGSGRYPKGSHLSVPANVKDTMFAEGLDPSNYHAHALAMIKELDDAHAADPMWKQNIATVQQTMTKFPMIHTAQLGNIPLIEQSGLHPAHEFHGGLAFDQISGLDRTVFMRMGQAGGGGHGAVGVMIDPAQLDPDKLIITRLGAMTLKQQEDAFLRTPGDHTAMVSEQLKPYRDGTIPYTDLHAVQSRMLVDGYEKDHPDAKDHLIPPATILQNDHGEMEVKYADVIPPKALIAYFAGDQPLEQFGGKSAYDYLKGKVPDNKLVKYEGEGLHQLSQAYRAHYASVQVQKDEGIGGITQKYDKDQPRSADGRFAEASNPRIFRTPADLSPQYTTMGGEKRYQWAKEPGHLLTGEPIARPDLPETLYHVTTNAPAVESSGVLLGQKTGAGLGGGQENGVSFTASHDDAVVIQREMVRSIRIARGDDKKDAIARYAREDEQTAGLKPMSLEPAVEYGLSSYEAGSQGIHNTFIWDKATDTGGYIGPPPPKEEQDRIHRSLTFDALNSYLQLRESTAEKVTGHIVDTLKNPMVMGDIKQLAKIDPSAVKILEIPSAQIPAAALVTTGSDKFLHEVRAYSDVPIHVQKREKPKCPHCGSHDYWLMPADFETAKCMKCKKNWNHGIVPGINDPSEKWDENEPRNEKGEWTSAEVIARMRKYLPAADSNVVGAPFLLPDGTRLGMEGNTHADSLIEHGIMLEDALKAGVIRVNSGHAIEVSQGMMTAKQARIIVDDAIFLKKPLYVDVDDPITGDTSRSHEWDLEDDISPSGLRAWVNNIYAKKADPQGRYVTPFVSFDKQGEDKLQLIASLNASRLSTWGFTAEADFRGLQRYRLTAILDGRTSDFCRYVASGRIFEVADARKKVVEVLNVQNPDDLRTMQPWPNQSKASIESYRKMSNAQLVKLGLHIPPFHPRCRTLCRTLVGAPKLKAVEQPELSPQDQEPQKQFITAETLKELGITATQDQVNHWNDVVGVNPTVCFAKLTDQLVAEIINGINDPYAVAYNAFFNNNGQIGLGAEGILEGVGFAIGTVIDPYSGAYYLTEADLTVGTPDQAEVFLRRLFNGLIDLGQDMTAANELVVPVAGNAVTYIKMGFLPDQTSWDTIRAHALKDLSGGGVLEDVFNALEPDDQLLMTQILQDMNVNAISALADVQIPYNGTSLGLALLEQVTGNFSFDLRDADAVTQAKEYLQV